MSILLLLLFYNVRKRLKWLIWKRKKEKGKSSLFVALRLNCSYKNKKKNSEIILTQNKMRRAGLDSVDLLAFYGSVIRPVLEYACPVWHTSLAVADYAKIESIQRRAMRIIEPELSYEAACSKHHLEKTSFRRENLSRKFFTAIKSASHKLHHILPQPKSTRYSLRNSSKLSVPKTNTNRFKNSLIPYGLFHYQ